VETLATKVFEETWVAEVRRRYGFTSTFTRPFVAFLALDPKAYEERSKIEEWFKTLPEDIKPDFLGRLRDISEIQHLSAYDELVVRHLFQSMGYSVTIRPRLEEGEPDLLVEGKNLKTPVVVEVATVFDEPGWGKEKKKLHKILAELEKIHHYFFVSISVRCNCIPENLNYKKLRQFVEKWLDGFDPRDIKVASGTTYREDGLWLELTLMPRTILEKSSIIGAYSPQARWISPKQLKSAIEKKIQKYKSIKKQNAAYVVAVCLHQDALVDEDEAIETLFGKQKWTVDVIKKQIVDVKRDFSGLVTPKPGLGGLVQNKRLSALLVVRSKWLQPLGNGEERREHIVSVLHNPNANIPLSQEFLKGHPQLI
jgi:hypothetical protein